MGTTAIVTGGTGGLGAAVVKRLLDGGWRVIVPWVAEAELARVPERDGLELVQADLFDPDAVGPVVAAATADAGAPLRGLVNLVGGFAMGARVHETPISEFERQFRLNLRPTYLMTAAALGPMLEAGSGSIVCVGTRAALQPFPGAAGYISVQGGSDRFHAGGRRRVPQGRDPLQCDPAEHDRHPSEPRFDAERRPLQVGSAGRDRRRHRLPAVRRRRADERRGGPRLRPRLSDRPGPRPGRASHGRRAPDHRPGRRLITGPQGA